MTDANQSDAVVVPEGWIKHDGGPCPVNIWTCPGVLLRSGTRYQPGTLTAAFWAGDMWDCWRRIGLGRDLEDRLDIIAYKPEPGAGGGKG